VVGRYKEPEIDGVFAAIKGPACLQTNHPVRMLKEERRGGKVLIMDARARACNVI